MANSSALNSGKIEQRARAVAEPLLTQSGFTLWDVLFEKEGAMWYLRILFDKDGGIDSDECEAVTEPLNKLMDAEPFIKDVDILEIGSPGLMRKLRRPEHFRSCIGQSVKASVKDEKNKTVVIAGTLSEYDEQAATIKIASQDGEKILSVPDCVKIITDLT